MNYLRCSPVHFNANVITALSSFVMLRECWLGIPPDSGLFWYYYSPSNTPTSSMVGSSYLCAAIVGMSIFQHSSKVAEKITKEMVSG
jgi:hypothetical protein